MSPSAPGRETGRPTGRESGRQTVRVTIFNQTYQLVARENAEALEALARRVDHLMQEIATKTGYADSLRIAVLACLHIADEAQSLQEELESLRRRLGEKSAEFATLLEQVLTDEPGRREEPGRGVEE